jgi:mono/diheme cytochrome c family protein
MWYTVLMHRSVHQPALAAALFLACLSVLGAEGPNSEGLLWDSPSRAFEAKRGETNAFFRFHFANVSSEEVVVRGVRTSCSCTVASLPEALPWRVAPGQGGQIGVDVDLRERFEPFHQIITIDTSAGTNQLTLAIQTAELTQREKNRRVAFADRQAVFKGDCASCHFQPAVGKPLPEQFQVLCGTCHDAKERAAMVPDLAKRTKPRDKAYWDQWLRRGKPGTFMPAFGKPWGGPLHEDQLAALEVYLMARFPDGKRAEPK